MTVIHLKDLPFSLNSLNTDILSDLLIVKNPNVDRTILLIRMFYNYQQHKVDRSGNYFFPFISVVKFVLVTDQFDGVYYQVFLLIMCIKKLMCQDMNKTNRT